MFKHIVILCVFIVVLLLLLRSVPFYLESQFLPGYSAVNEVSEAFKDKIVEELSDPFQPGSGEPVHLHDGRPYHLLDMSAPREKESLSCVNSRSCYATDFQRMIEKTGSFRQLTNNYKRGYPDSCSGAPQELTLNFYKSTPM